jgi:DNA-directed RNA polymerase specialized sigma24 family protein
MNEFAKAAATLQRITQTSASRSHFLTERYDEALNDLVRNPDRPGDARQLVDVALTNSRKKLAHRAPVTPRASSETLDLLEPTGGIGTTAAPTEPDELPDWFVKLRPRTRRLIGLSALGFEPGDVARLDGVSRKSAWEALSRARAEARAALEAA